MRNLGRNIHKEAQTALTSANSLLDYNNQFVNEPKYSSLKILTLNNQACYYNSYKYLIEYLINRLNKPNAALQFLSKAIFECEKLDFSDPLDYASTLLNASAILSKMRKYSIIKPI